MPNIAEIETEQLREMAWEVNLNLREKLVDLKSNPPVEPVNLDTLQTEIASMMRLSDEYHSYLYLRELNNQENPEDYFSQIQDNRQLARKLDDYSQWRIKQLGKKGDSASKGSPVKTKLRQLEDTDPQRYKKLFETDLYRQGESSPYRNHWHKVLTYGADDEFFIDFGDNHEDISFVDVIASYKKGFETSFYAYSELLHGQQTLDQGITADIRRFSILSKSIIHPQPHIIVGKEGAVKFDM